MGTPPSIKMDDTLRWFPRTGVLLSSLHTQVIYSIFIREHDFDIFGVAETNLKWGNSFITISGTTSKYLEKNIRLLRMKSVLFLLAPYQQDEGTILTLTIRRLQWI
jgi:hypothetical protein